jgi:pSer/pThr/pTyr-binding forkhead associated (FHA) protein
MPVRLILESGRSTKRAVRLNPGETLVGRHTECKLRIPSGEVSRRHCLLKVVGQQLTVSDLNSANGTFVNGQPVTKKQLVYPGDRLRIGPFTFLVNLEKDRTPKTAERLEECSALPDPLSAKPLSVAQVEAWEIIHRAELEEVDVVAENAEDDVVEVAAILDDDAPLQLPEANELRGILAKLTDSDQPLSNKSRQTKRRRE